jgi:hypothetical protein
MRTNHQKNIFGRRTGLLSVGMGRNFTRHGNRSQASIAAPGKRFFRSRKACEQKVVLEIVADAAYRLATS